MLLSFLSWKVIFDIQLTYIVHYALFAAELFSDVQPLVQSALDGYNVSIFAYGQTHSGKTHTMVSLHIFCCACVPMCILCPMVDIINFFLHLIIWSIAYLMFIHYSQEGSSYDRGLYARCFEELFDLANLDTTSTSQYKFCVTVCELYNEQVFFSFQLPCTPFLSCLCFASRFLFHLGLLNFLCKLLLCAFRQGIYFWSQGKTCQHSALERMNLS